VEMHRAEFCAATKKCSLRAFHHLHLLHVVLLDVGVLDARY
jgi:hypothetical protein